MNKVFRLALQVVDSVAVGTFLAAIGGCITYYIDNRNSSYYDISLVPALIVGVFIAYPIGAASGAYSAGKSLREKGSFWLTFVGSFLSLAIFFAAPSSGMIFVIFTPPLATIGFHLRAILRGCRQRPSLA